MRVSWSRWLAKEKSLAAKPNRCRRPRFRPCVEQLEDRLAPATYNVTTFNDVLGGHNGGPNYSLRQAILDSDITVGSSTINLPHGTYNLKLGGTTHDGTTGALLIYQSNRTINSIGGTAVIDAHGIDRVFDIRS